MAKSADYWRQVRKENSRKWRLANPEEYRRRAREHARRRRANATPEQKRAWYEQTRQWRLRNLEWCRQRDCAYAKRKRPERIESARVRQREYLRKCRLRPEHRALEALRSRLREGFRRCYKEGRSAELFGVGYWDHIVALLHGGMTPENYGKVWHIDHILPVSWFDAGRQDHRAACFHWSNMRPAFASENRGRSNKCTQEDFDFLMSRAPEHLKGIFTEVWNAGHPSVRRLSSTLP